MTQRWTLFIFVTLSMFGLDLALHCYTCRSVMKKGCGEKEDFNPSLFGNKTEGNCGVCMLATSVMFGIKVVHRDCKPSCPEQPSPPPAYLEKLRLRQWCCDDQDFCNKATDGIPSLAIILAGVAAVWIAGHAS